MVSALAAETMEDQYLAMVERHKDGKPGKRGIDLMSQMFGELVDAMTRDENDILGDLFQGSITYGEAGQFLSPQSIAELLARMSVDPDARPTRDRTIYVSDPACGTGRMLLAATNVNPHLECVGVDVDARCVKITSVNLGLRSRYGYVVCGNSLSGHMQFAYRIGSFFHEGPNGRRRGVIRDIAAEDTPVPVIASRLRDETQNLFDQPQVEEAEAADDTDPQLTLPAIIEVPQWLSRLEPQLAALDAPTEESGEPAGDIPPPVPDPLPRTQRPLF